MSLTLPANHLQAIHAHAARTYPEECCGLLLGKLTADEKWVYDVYAVPNAWTIDPVEGSDDRVLTKSRRYSIAPTDLLAGMRAARQQQLEIVGIYHSHPDHPAVPSECDRSQAWSQYSYLIIAVEQGTAQDSRSWVLNDHHQFEPEILQVAETARM